MYREQKVTFHSAASATATGTVLNCAGMSSLVVQITGTFVATVTWQGTIDGTNWVSLQAENIASGAVATTATAAGLYRLSVAGLRLFRANMAWTSGTSITAIGIASAAPVGLTLADIDVAGTETVTVASITAGETVIGRVGSTSTSIALTPAISAGAYSAGDVVGGLLTFANAARVSGYGGVIKNVLIVDDAGQDAELELWLFDRTFTPIADNGAWAPAEADLENLIVVVSTEDSGQGWMAAGTPSACDIEVARAYKLTGTSMFGQLVTRGTPTFAATDDVTVTVTLLQD